MHTRTLRLACRLLLCSILLGAAPVLNGAAAQNPRPAGRPTGRPTGNVNAQQAAYPTLRQIQNDLIGHSLAEGVSNGYRPEGWSWKIQQGQISRLRIDRVLEKTRNRYVIATSMRLSNRYYSYNAKVKIKYIRSGNRPWKMDYAVSQGMYIVNTHEYDNFVYPELVEDGWGGTYCLQLTNRSEIPLAAGGDILTYDGWRRFMVRIPPHGSQTVGGLFGGGTVTEYRINFIVRTQ